MKFSKQHQRYQSEFTQFISELKQKDPGLEERQREGRFLLWDKAPIDLDQRDRIIDSSVKQRAYVYQNEG